MRWGAWWSRLHLPGDFLSRAQAVEIAAVPQALFARCPGRVGCRRRDGRGHAAVGAVNAIERRVEQVNAGRGSRHRLRRLPARRGLDGDGRTGPYAVEY